MTCTAYMTYLFFVLILLLYLYDVYLLGEGICKIVRTHEEIVQFRESNPASEVVVPRNYQLS